MGTDGKFLPPGFRGDQVVGAVVDDELAEVLGAVLDGGDPDIGIETRRQRQQLESEEGTIYRAPTQRKSISLAPLGMTTKKARTLRPAPLFLPLPRLLLAPGAGGTTIGGTAARCVCRLCRSCETERDDCYQQNCPNGLHDFLL